MEKTEHRMHRGDIFVNKWAGDANPIKTEIFLGYYGKYGIGFCWYKGIHKSSFYKSDLENDTKHFVIIGHVDLKSVIENIFKTCIYENYRQ